jgi:hypothetical protein
LGYKGPGLEKQLSLHRANLAHVDATMRLFDPGIKSIGAPQLNGRHDWFRRGECRRLIYDVLRDAPSPMTTQEITEAVVKAKGLVFEDAPTRGLIAKTILNSLSRADQTIARVKLTKGLAWRII